VILSYGIMLLAEEEWLRVSSRRPLRRLLAPFLSPGFAESEASSQSVTFCIKRPDNRLTNPP